MYLVSWLYMNEVADDLTAQKQTPISSVQLKALQVEYGKIAWIGLESPGYGKSKRIVMCFRQILLTDRNTKRPKKKAATYAEAVAILKSRAEAVYKRGSGEVTLTGEDGLAVQIYGQKVTRTFGLTVGQGLALASNIIYTFEGDVQTAERVLNERRRELMRLQPEKQMKVKELIPIFENALENNQIFSIAQVARSGVKRRLAAVGAHKDLLRGVRLFANENGESFIDTWTSEDLDEWLETSALSTRNSLGKDSTASGTFNRRLTALRRLFDVAKKEGAIAKAAQHAADAVNYRQRSMKPGLADIYSPQQALQILNGLTDPMRLLLVVLRCFAGIRLAECCRMTWDRVCFETGEITLPGNITKTGVPRSIIIQPNLMEWLLPFKGQKGMVLNFDIQAKAFANLLNRDILGILGLTVFNGFRHSFCSYRVAQCRNSSLSADEAGHDVKTQRANYWKLVSALDAAFWFSIRPRTKNWPEALNSGFQSEIAVMSCNPDIDFADGFKIDPVTSPKGFRLAA